MFTSMWTLIFWVCVTCTNSTDRIKQTIIINNINNEEMCELNAAKIDSQLKLLSTNIVNQHVCIFGG